MFGFLLQTITLLSLRRADRHLAGINQRLVSPYFGDLANWLQKAFCRHRAFATPDQFFKGYQMYPVHDVDAILLLAMLLACKRRPAHLVEIIAAADLALGAIPPETKLSDSFYRLSEYGLICPLDGGYALTADAQQILSGHAKKAKSQERIHDIKENLADFHLNGEHVIIQLPVEQIAAAIVEHQAAKRSPGKSLLTPKPKPAEDLRKYPGQRKPYQSFAARRRKD